MHINPINNYNLKTYNLGFGVNLQSKKLQFKNDDFFIKIKGYGTNSDWAKRVINAADEAIELIRDNVEYESVLRFIAFRVQEANQFTSDTDKIEHTGILRVNRKWWLCHSDWSGTNLITRYSNNYKNKYNTYADRFDYTVKHPLINPYSDIALTRPVHDKNVGKFLDHAEAKYINNAFLHIKKIYDKLYSNYVLKEVEQKDLENVNDSIAEIRWILAHTTPWERGSDAISNTFVRSIYKAMGIKASPLKRGVSLDLEAYCTELDDYKKNFSSYFQQKPYIVE